MSAQGDMMRGVVGWLLDNRWLVLAIVLLVVLAIRFALRDREPPPGDDDVGEPPPAGGVA